MFSKVGLETCFLQLVDPRISSLSCRVPDNEIVLHPPQIFVVKNVTFYYELV